MILGMTSGRGNKCDQSGRRRDCDLVPAPPTMPSHASSNDDRRYHYEDSYLHDAKPPKHQWQRLLAGLPPFQSWDGRSALARRRAFFLFVGRGLRAPAPYVF
jgi:hypothetical protein